MKMSKLNLKNVEVEILASLSNLRVIEKELTLFKSIFF